MSTKSMRFEIDCVLFLMCVFHIELFVVVCVLHGTSS